MPNNGQVLKPLVDIGISPDSCWEWQGTVNPITGYGKKRYCGRDVLAHRWVYELLLGPIPAGLVINHKCSNKKCVNPHHLEIVNQADNCRHGNGSKLSIEAVRKIKAAKDSKKRGDGTRLAHKHGVSTALIFDIWYGRAWADVE